MTNERLPQRRQSVLKLGEEAPLQDKHILVPLLVFSEISFALFVCTDKLHCDVFTVFQCVRNGLVAMQEEAVV